MHPKDIFLLSMLNISGSFFGNLKVFIKNNIRSLSQFLLPTLFSYVWVTLAHFFANVRHVEEMDRDHYLVLMLIFPFQNPSQQNKVLLFILEVIG